MTAGPADNKPSAPPPRANPLLLGHGKAERAVLEALEGGRMAHAWLITGPPGIGKATFAFRLARYLLVEGKDAGRRAALPPDLAVDVGHPVFHRVAGGGHADLLTVERGLDDRRQRLRSDIVVDDVRTVGPFLASTAAEGGWRVVIVDGADAMTISAANALLKVLEEPPDSAVLILTAASAGRVLPTIRSRCRRLALAPLPLATVAELLVRYRPALPPGEVNALASCARGSIGEALRLADGDGLAVKVETARLVAGLPMLDTSALFRLADRVAAAGDDVPFRLCAETLLEWLHAVVRTAAGAPPAADPGSAAARADGGDDEAMAAAQSLATAAARASLDRWLEVWDNTARLLSQAEHASLDRRHALLSAVLGVRAVLGG